MIGSMMMQPAGLPTNIKPEFWVRAEMQDRTPSSTLRTVSGSNTSNAFTPASTTVRGRRYVHRADSVEGIGFLSSGFLVGYEKFVIGIFHLPTYNSVPVLIRDRNSLDSATGLVFPFKNASNIWGFTKVGSQYVYANGPNAAVATFADTKMLQVVIDGDGGRTRVHYNGVEYSDDETYGSGNTTNPIATTIGRGYLPVLEVVVFNDTNSASRIALESYMKYRAGTP